MLFLKALFTAGRQAENRRRKAEKLLAAKPEITGRQAKNHRLLSCNRQPLRRKPPAAKLRAAGR
jgi:hypothetical protein